jgi:hypothetical protein
MTSAKQLMSATKGGKDDGGGNEKEYKKSEKIEPRAWPHHLGHAKLSWLGAVPDSQNQHPILDDRQKTEVTGCPFSYVGGWEINRRCELGGDFCFARKPGPPGGLRSAQAVRSP